MLKIAMEKEIIYRRALPKDIEFLKNMLYEAVYWRSIKQNKAPDIDEGLTADGVMNALHNWGKGTLDLGIIADSGAELLGAAWIRYYNSSNSIRGFIDESIPVLVIGIAEEYRNRGIGTDILETLFDRAASEGIQSISLMVSEDNDAFNLYRKVGFEIKNKDADSFLMVKEL